MTPFSDVFDQLVATAAAQINATPTYLQVIWSAAQLSLASLFAWTIILGPYLLGGWLTWKAVSWIADKIAPTANED